MCSSDLILYLFGGEGLHGFAFALVIGFLSGTYSTIYIATPILIDWVATKPASPNSAKASKQLATARLFVINDGCRPHKTGGRPSQAARQRLPRSLADVRASTRLWRSRMTV